MLNWQKSNLITITVPIGDTTIYTEARLAFRTDDNGNIGLAIHPLRKEPQLDFPYMGYKFSPKEKEALRITGNLGKTIEVTPKNAEPFSAYVSIDPQTNEIIALRADRVNIPKEIKGVTLSDAQYKDLVEGKVVKVEDMTAKSGKTFDATLQVNAERKGIEFIFDNNRGFKEQEKAERIESWLLDHPDHEEAKQSLAALRAATPTPIPFADLDFNLGERWIPSKVYGRFASEFFGTDIGVSYHSNMDEYSIVCDHKNANISGTSMPYRGSSAVMTVSIS